MYRVRENQCGRISEMRSQYTVYETTGIFASACRHGFILAICEMVWSGELYIQFQSVYILLMFMCRAKYPLAVVDHHINMLGNDQATGYDIGCSFTSTVATSKLVGPKAEQAAYRFSVNSFHGYAHSRVCQLDHHPLYLKGWGIEDLEGLECVFLASNAVTPTICYAT